MLDCVTQCSQSAARLYEQFLQVQHIGFVTLGLLRHAPLDVFCSTLVLVILYLILLLIAMSCYCPFCVRLSHLIKRLLTYRGGCLELYYCNMVEWFWWDSSLISTTNWFNRPRNDLQYVEWDVKQPSNSEWTQNGSRPHCARPTPSAEFKG